MLGSARTSEAKALASLPAHLPQKGETQRLKCQHLGYASAPACRAAPPGMDSACNLGSKPRAPQPARRSGCFSWESTSGSVSCHVTLLSLFFPNSACFSSSQTQPQEIGEAPPLCPIPLAVTLPVSSQLFASGSGACSAPGWDRRSGCHGCFRASRVRTLHRLGQLEHFQPLAAWGNRPGDGLCAVQQGHVWEQIDFMGGDRQLGPKGLTSDSATASRCDPG